MWEQPQEQLSVGAGALGAKAVGAVAVAVAARQTHPSYTHDTCSRNRRHKSTPFFRRWFLVHVSCKSGTRFIWYQILARNRTQPETGVHMTEMMINHRLLFIFVISCKLQIVLLQFTYLQLFVAYVAFSRVDFWHQKFSFQMRVVRKTVTQKPMPENGVNFWRRFLKCVSWILVCD